MCHVAGCLIFSGQHDTRNHSPAPQSETINSSVLSLVYGPGINISHASGQLSPGATSTEPTI